ncbi:MAG: hypothetical protein U5L01_09355 [Rheinheimera sp.]|nr:hypothetical protein [Rheinheimera sp.]
MVASPAMINQTTLATGASSDSEFQEQTLSADQHQSEQFVEEPYTPEATVAVAPTPTVRPRPATQPPVTPVS